jgi:replicative DNA helicase
MGKTAFACSLLINMAKEGSPVGIISLEMPNVQLAGRFASIVSGIEFWRIYRNKPSDMTQQEKILTGIYNMASLPVYSTDNAKVNISDIRWKAEKLVKTKGAKCIIVDYIQLVSTEGGKKNETREREVAKLSAGLKAISKDLNIVVIALAQLNRESETPDKVSRPGKLSQLRESDAILADADMGIIVDRPFKRGETTDDKGESTENKASIIIEKFRNGETKTINLHFNPASMHFQDQPTFHYPILPDMINHAPPIIRTNPIPDLDIPF